MTAYTSGKTTHESGVCHCGTDVDQHSVYSDNHNPVEMYPDNHSPILVAFRKFNAADPQLDTAEGWLWGIENGHHDPATPEQLDHARRVLTKLAALTTKNGVTD